MLIKQSSMVVKWVIIRLQIISLLVHELTFLITFE